MDLHLSGKAAVVTGASKGIGLAITQALADEGVSVAAGARNASDELSQVAARAPVRPVLTELTTPAGPAHLVREAVTAFGSLDVLVNNVGAVRPHVEGFLSFGEDDWERALSINLLAAVRTTRAAVPHLLERGQATIVTICSVNAVLPDPTIIDYCASKAALMNFSKALSKEVGPRGIRVNTISPGPVSTALWLSDDGVAASIARATGGQADAVAKQAASQSVTGRFTTP